MSPKWDRQKDSGSRPRFLPGSHGGGGAAAVRGTSALEFAINMQRRSEEEEGALLALLGMEWRDGPRPREDTDPLLSQASPHPHFKVCLTNGQATEGGRGGILRANQILVGQSEESCAENTIKYPG